MKKYLGSIMTAYAAILIPLFGIGALIFGIVAGMSAFRKGQTGAGAFLLVLGISCFLLSIRSLRKERSQLYSWGVFGEKGVLVKTLFKTASTLEYSKCRSCGIAMYRHAFMNSQNSPLGTDMYFIFLSLLPFSEKYRAQINLWRPTPEQIKVRFSEKLYTYLLLVLPAKQNKMLMNDYEYYIAAKKKNSIRKK